MAERNCTDKEIMRAFACCHTTEGTCADCPFDGKQDACWRVEKLALDLLHRKKAEVEEIFEVVDDLIGRVCAMTGLGDAFFGKYAELKEKFWGGGDTGVPSAQATADTNDGHKEEFFTPEEVRRMSNAEVRANYDKIMRSIGTW